MPTRLYANAQHRFCSIFPNVARESSSASTTCDGRSPKSTMDATSEAAPTPPAIAMPTSASASAAASFMPSPTMATRAPEDLSCATKAALPSGATSPMASAASTPSAAPTAPAVSCRSPESSITRTPRCFSLDTVNAASSLISSSISSTPTSVPSNATNTGVFLAATSATSRSAFAANESEPETVRFEGLAMLAKDSQNARVPTATLTPSTTPTAPFPGVCLKVSSATARGGAAASSAAAATATASGCLELRSTAAAMESSVKRSTPLFSPSPPSPPQSTRVTRGLPTVSVPVLSKTTQSSLCARSSTSPPRMSKPCLAPSDVPTSTAVGVASPSAQGHATTSTDAAICRPSRSGALAGEPAAEAANAAVCNTCGKSFVPARLQNANVAADAPITP
mmetsp:Transcript_13916/g.59539  ORF Transcript_13916/g.59539 Transcript_13916/m.59539 type:complete len:396 (-) Transcript_13916:1277-2464(-)